MVPTDALIQELETMQRSAARHKKQADDVAAAVRSRVIRHVRERELTGGQAAAILGVTRQRVHAMLKAGQ